MFRYQAPIFIFSLPRSGSTLLQRILASHADIATLPEPWILLPHVFATNEYGAYSIYGHQLAARAHLEFLDALPDGRNKYHIAMRDFIQDLYKLACRKGERYFLDKTPRYHLIANQILSLFPDCPAIFLFRNPLAVAASVIQTWGGGRFKIHGHRIDLYEGLQRLTSAYRTHRSRVLALRYEDLVLNPEAEVHRICRYLSLDFQSTMLDAFREMSLPSSYGDPNRLRYQGISTHGLTAWQTVMRTGFRQWWSRRYIDWIGEDRLDLMGYSLNGLRHEVSSLDRRLGPSLIDAVFNVSGLLWSVLDLHILADKVGSRKPTEAQRFRARPLM